MKNIKTVRSDNSMNEKVFNIMISLLLNELIRINKDLENKDIDILIELLKCSLK